MENKEVTFGVFLDIERASDITSIIITIEAAKEHGLEDTMSVDQLHTWQQANNNRTCLGNSGGV
jgi:hypothetical protein